jgi:plastocyanin
MFTPKTVHVKVGDTVTWTNHDDILHTVTSGIREYEPGNSGHVTATHKDGMFDMQMNGKGATGKHTFTEAGTFHYFCDRHPGMEADVEVS